MLLSFLTCFYWVPSSDAPPAMWSFPYPLSLNTFVICFLNNNIVILWCNNLSCYYFLLCSCLWSLLALHDNVLMCDDTDPIELPVAWHKTLSWARESMYQGLHGYALPACILLGLWVWSLWCGRSLRLTVEYNYKHSEHRLWCGDLTGMYCQLDVINPN